MEIAETGVACCKLFGYAYSLGIFIDAEQLTRSAQAPKNELTMSTTAKSCVYILAGGVADQIVDRRIQKHRAMGKLRSRLRLAIRGHRDSASKIGRASCRERGEIAG